MDTVTASSMLGNGVTTTLRIMPLEKVRREPCSSFAAVIFENRNVRSSPFLVTAYVTGPLNENVILLSESCSPYAIFVSRDGS